MGIPPIYEIPGIQVTMQEQDSRKMGEREQPGGAAAALAPLYIVAAFVLIVTACLTINIAMNGSEAVIDITPRFADEPRKTGALIPCLSGWGILGLLWWLRTILLKSLK